MTLLCLQQRKRKKERIYSIDAQTSFTLAPAAAVVSSAFSLLHPSHNILPPVPRATACIHSSLLYNNLLLFLFFFRCPLKISQGRNFEYPSIPCKTLPLRPTLQASLLAATW